MNTSFENVKVLQSLNKHASDVTSCDIAPNFILVTGSSDKTVRIWDWICGSGYTERLCSPLRGHKYAVTCVKVSPQGCIIASSSVDGTTVLWNMHSGNKIHTLVQINGDSVRTCRFSADSTVLATAGDNGAICIWDVIHKSLIRTVIDHEGAIQSLAFTPDSEFLISACSMEKIKVWYVQSLIDTTEDSCSPLCYTDNAHDLGILYMDISNVIVLDDGNPLVRHYTLATSGNNKKIKIWRISSHILPKEEESAVFVSLENISTYYGHDSAVTCVKFSSNGNFLFSSSIDRSIRIWNNLGACIKILNEHSRYVNCVALSKDCSLLATGSNDKSVLIWDINGNLDLDFELVKPSALLASALQPLQATELQLAQNPANTFNLIGKIDDIAESSINSCHFSVDNVLAVGSGDKLVKTFKIDEHTNIEDMNVTQLKGHTYAVTHVEFSKSGSMLVSCSLDGCTIIWEPLTGEKVTELPRNDLAVKDCCFSINEKRLITVGDDEKAHIWDINTSELLLSIDAHSDAVTSACFSPDDNIFVTTCSNGEFKLWSTHGTNIYVEYYAHDLGIIFCDFSENLEPIPLLPSNGKHNYLLATCGNDSLVKLWTIVLNTKKTESLKVKKWRTFVGHGGNVTCVRFSPGLSELVASTATDRQLRIWSVYSGECLQVLNHDAIITSCCFNSNCCLLVTGCLDKSLWLWKLPENLTMEMTFTKKVTTTTHKKPLSHWNSQDVAKWLNSIGFTEIADTVSDIGINGKKILTLEEESICRSLQLNEEGTEKLIRELRWLKEDELHPNSTDQNGEYADIPDKFLCPITHEIMKEPVTCSDGFTYEKQAISEWFISGKYTSPLTNQTLPNGDFVINLELRNEIHAFLYGKAHEPK